MKTETFTPAELGTQRYVDALVAVGRGEAKIEIAAEPKDLIVLAGPDAKDHGKYLAALELAKGDRSKVVLRP